MTGEADPLAGTDLVAPGERSTGLQTTVGKALDWHSAGWGTFVDDVPQSLATREIDSIAGSDEIGGLGAATLWEGVRQAALGTISGAAFMPGCDALELRYVTTPAVGAPTRVQLFITAKSREWHHGTADAAVEAACAALPRGFTWTGPVTDMGFGRPWIPDDPPILELRRHEEVTIPQWDYIPAEFYYTVNDDPGDGSGWQRFFQVLAQASRSVTISLLFKRTEIDWDERNVLAGITSDLALVAEPHSDFDVIGNQINYPADTNAQVALESWNRRISQLQRPVLARLAIRAPCDIGPSIATALATAIAASSEPGSSIQPMYLEAPQNHIDERKAAYCFDCLEIWPWGGHPIWTDEKAPNILRRLPYLYGLNDVAGLAVLPVPDEQGVPGFERARRNVGRRAAISATVGTGPGVRLGDVLHQGQPAGEIKLPLAAILRHVLIVGASGSGKTTTVHSLLAELWREHRVPFLAIEPIKTEYRALLEASGMEDLQVIALGRDDISPMRLNPLQPPPSVRCEAHSSAVMSALKLAMPLFPPLPQLLEAALDRAYRVAGWDYDTTPEENIPAPTVRSLLASFEVVFEQEGYVGEARNISAALRVRLKSLLQGSRGRVFDTVESTDFAQLMQRPVVIELDALGDGEDKAIIAAFVLGRIRAAARARASSGGDLKHVTVVEEAHRLLARADEGRRDGVSGDNTRADAVRAFCEAIRELRAQGEGFILSSQRPADLALAAVATTSTRILHRLETADDRQDVLDDLDASQLDREAAARLRVGEALTRWADQDDAELIRVRTATGVDTGRNVDDGVVARHMADMTALTRSLLPYALCTRDVCPQGCQASIRSEGKLIAEDAGAEARQHWTSKQASAEALEPIAKLLAREAEGNAQLAYCGAAHLAMVGDAFVLKRKRDIRPQVAKAIEKAATEL